MTEALKNEIMQAISAAADLTAIEAVRVDALGKKGKVTELLKTLGSMDAEARKTTGASINLLKEEISTALEAKKTALEQAALAVRLATEKVDITLPAPSTLPSGNQGTIHPISQTMEELIEIFAAQGFVLAEGPNIEDEEHNFNALNIPENHPARQMQDTFYLPTAPDGTRYLPRTQTSAVQIRYMRANTPPYRIMVLGRTYRSENDATHTPMFHQMEGLVIEKGITMAHLRGCLEQALSSFFGAKVETRFRPSYFPFTEPSVEVDVRCNRQGGKLVIGEGDDWLEILGAGMVHPNVLRACNLDPETWQGFAFGAGLDRLTMLKYGIPDLRPMFESDVRWLSHYGFAAHDIPSKARGTL